MLDKPSKTFNVPINLLQHIIFSDLSLAEFHVTFVILHENLGYLVLRVLPRNAKED